MKKRIIRILVNMVLNAIEEIIEVLQDANANEAIIKKASKLHEDATALHSEIKETLS